MDTNDILENKETDFETKEIDESSTTDVETESVDASSSSFLEMRIDGSKAVTSGNTSSDARRMETRTSEEFQLFLSKIENMKEISGNALQKETEEPVSTPKITEERAKWSISMEDSNKSVMEVPHRAEKDLLKTVSAEDFTLPTAVKELTLLPKEIKPQSVKRLVTTEFEKEFSSPRITIKPTEESERTYSKKDIAISVTTLEMAEEIEEMKSESVKKLLAPESNNEFTPTPATTEATHEIPKLISSETTNESLTTKNSKEFLSSKEDTSKLVSDLLKVDSKTEFSPTASIMEPVHGVPMVKLEPVKELPTMTTTFETEVSLPEVEAEQARWHQFFSETIGSAGIPSNDTTITESAKNISFPSAITEVSIEDTILNAENKNLSHSEIKDMHEDLTTADNNTSVPGIDALEEFTLPEVVIKSYDGIDEDVQSETESNIAETLNGYDVYSSLADDNTQKRYSTGSLPSSVKSNTDIGYKRRGTLMMKHLGKVFKLRTMIERERSSKPLEAVLSHKPSKRILELACPVLPYFNLYGENHCDIAERTKLLPKPRRGVAESYLRLLPPLKQVEYARPRPFDDIHPPEIARRKKPKLIIFPKPCKPTPKPISKRVLDLSIPRRNLKKLREEEIEAMRKIYQVSKAALTAVASERVQILSKPKGSGLCKRIISELKQTDTEKRKSLMMAPLELGAAISGLSKLPLLIKKELSSSKEKLVSGKSSLEVAQKAQRKSTESSRGGGEGWGSQDERSQLEMLNIGAEMGRRRQSMQMTPGFEGVVQRRQSVMLMPGIEGGGQRTTVEGGGRRRQSVLLSTDILQGVPTGGGFSGLSEIAPVIKSAKVETKAQRKKKKKAPREIELTPPPPVIGGVVFQRRACYTDLQDYPFGSLTSEALNKPQIEFQEGSEELDAEEMKRILRSRKSRTSRQSKQLRRIH